MRQTTMEDIRMQIDSFHYDGGKKEGGEKRTEQSIVGTEKCHDGMRVQCRDSAEVFASNDLTRVAKYT